jgi:hypothetical protein
MKKILSALAALFVFLAFLPHDVAEAKSYDMTKYDMFIEVKTNGNANVKEKITYDFSGDFNGVYRNIDLDGTDGCKDVRVYVDEGSTLREFSPGWGKNPNEYERSQDGNIMSLKVYEKTSSREKTFVYEYTLKNVAKKYNDIGVFNRKVIDRNWDVPLKDISIEIRIPEGATKDELKVFAHGPLEGYSEIINERTSSFYVGEVMPGTFVETLIIFPPNLIPDSQRVFSHDELPAILENEQRLADEANRIREEARARMAQEERLKNIRKKLFPVFLTVIFGAVASFISMNLKYGRDLKPEFDGDYYRDLPGDYTPPVMTYLLTKNVGPNDVMATIMDLVRKKRLKITKIDSEQSGGLFSRNKTVEKYMLEKVKDANLEGLTRHEVFLMEWFVDKLGEGKGLILDDLKEKVKGKNAALEFQRNYETFKELVKMEGSTKDFFTGNDLTGSAMFLLIDLGLILGGIASIKFLHALGSGGLIGVGLGQSRQKFFYLPEPQTDFIFSVIGEELGFLGAAFVILVFMFFIWRGYRTAMAAPDIFGKLMATGITTLIALQFLINVAVVTASVPVTGMPLPFISYGGSSLTITMSQIGILLNISRYTEVK